MLMHKEIETWQKIKTVSGIIGLPTPGLFFIIHETKNKNF
jgi:hypothetical protein